MNIENNFWLTILLMVFATTTILSSLGIATHNKNQDRLMECSKYKTAIECQCLIHAYNNCLLAN